MEPQLGWWQWVDLRGVRRENRNTIELSDQAHMGPPQGFGFRRLPLLFPSHAECAWLTGRRVFAPEFRLSLQGLDPGHLTQ